MILTQQLYSERESVEKIIYFIIAVCAISRQNKRQVWSCRPSFIVRACRRIYYPAAHVPCNPQQTLRYYTFGLPYRCNPVLLRVTDTVTVMVFDKVSPGVEALAD